MKPPKISIVTPSFNSEEFVAATVESVIKQNYANLEYWVMDGASTDRTAEIARSYGSSVQVVSEKDAGQSDAINKGFRRCTGEIVSWVNSNDIYLPGSFDVVGRYFAEHPEADLVFGRALLIDEAGESLGEYPEYGSPEEMLRLNADPRGHFNTLLNDNAGWIPQQTAFWRKSLMDKAGLLNRDLHYAMDYEYWLRLGSVGTIHFLDAMLGAFRLHGEAKSGMARKHWKEILAIHSQYGGRVVSGVNRRFLEVALGAVGRRVRRVFA